MNAPNAPSPPRVPGLWVFALLYFSEGAPIGFLWWAMPTLLRTEGVPLARITALTAALVLPWTLKFLWAPVVDAWRGPRWGFRSWVVAAQLGMGACLLPLIFVDPAGGEGFGLWFGLLLAHAFFAATQDVAIDALAIASSEAAGHGRLNGAMQVGMLAGRGLFGGGAIFLATWGGWPVVFAALLVVIWGSLVVMLRVVPEPRREARAPGAWRMAVRGVLRRPTTWLGLGFALVAGAGFEATGALAGPMLVDLGVPTEVTGWFFAAVVVAAMAGGSWWGGRRSDRGGEAGRPGEVLRVLLGLSAAISVVALVVVLDLRWWVVLLGLAAVYGGIGWFTATTYALFMDITDKRLGATQFTAFMAATNGCEAWAAWMAGRAVGVAGYGPALLIMVSLSLFGLIFLAGMHGRDAGHEA